MMMMSKLQLILDEIDELIEMLETEEDNARFFRDDCEDFYVQGLEFPQERIYHIKSMIERIVRDENTDETLTRKISVSENQLPLI